VGTVVPGKVAGTTGVLASGSVGTIAGVSRTIALTGVAASGTVGNVVAVYWKLIDDSQTANWGLIDTSETNDWVLINTA
jgi:hypothetical protein